MSWLDPKRRKTRRRIRIRRRKAPRRIVVRRRSIRRVASKPKLKIDIKEIGAGIAGVIVGVIVQAKVLSGKAGTTVISGSPIDNLAVGIGVAGIPVVDSYTKGLTNTFLKGAVLGSVAKGVAVPLATMGYTVASSRANPLAPIAVPQ